LPKYESIEKKIFENVNKELIPLWKEQTEKYLKDHREKFKSRDSSSSVSPISSRRPSEDKPLMPIKKSQGFM
jgi:hypothetical protein